MSGADRPVESGLVDLASERLGGAVLWANDEFFAPKENLLKAAAPVWKEDAYTDRGKWMDGWESRRRRIPGHDHCVIRLGLPGTIRNLVVDTSFFRGNYPESCSVEACYVEGNPTPEEIDATADWVEVLAQSPLQGHHLNTFEVNPTQAFTHLRFHIYPDGGVARLRVFGEVIPDHRALRRRGELDLAAMVNGGRKLAQSDMFFGDAQNLLQPGRGVNMGDGWETKRRRGPGHDWVVLQLAAEGTIDRIEVDTLHFKGNYPDRCSLELHHGEPSDDFEDDAWVPVLEEVKLQAHTLHAFEPAERTPATHVRFRIFPDGGVSRLRLWGAPTEHGWRELGLRALNVSTPERARRAFLTCCGSHAWAEGMVARMPFATEAVLLAAAEQVWSALESTDWLEAFAAHPRIGGRAAEKPTGAQAARWSRGEQAGTRDASQDTIDRLREGNDAYYDKHGFIFIIFASGRSAYEMLAELERRLDNDTPEEIVNAAAEQQKITADRIMKLVSGS